MRFTNKILEFYGNRGFLFDLIIALILLIVLSYFTVSISFVQDMISDRKIDALVSFFSILVGFLLTSFSLLFLYDPKESGLSNVRKHPAYKKMLYSFVSTSFITVVLSLFFLSGYSFPSEIVFFLMTFMILRIFKCLFYLYRIISIS